MASPTTVAWVSRFIETGPPHTTIRLTGFCFLPCPQNLSLSLSPLFAHRGSNCIPTSIPARDTPNYSSNSQNLQKPPQYKDRQIKILFPKISDCRDRDFESWDRGLLWLNSHFQF